MRRALALIVTLTLAAGVLTLAGPALPASAALLVNETADENNADGDCSLQEAVATVNTGAPIDACVVPGDGTIQLAADTYVLEHTIPITTAMVIQGAGWTDSVIDCAGVALDCFVHSGTDDDFTLTDLAIIDAGRHAVDIVPDAGVFTLERAIVTGSNDHAIVGDAGASPDIDIIDSVVAHSAGYGVLLHDGSVDLTRSLVLGNDDTAVATHSADIAIHQSTVMNNGSHGVDSEAGAVAVTASTFLGNDGFAVNIGAGSVAYESATLVGNARAVSIYGAGAATFRNTLAAASTFENCDNPQVQSLGWNLADDATCPFDQPTDQNDVDPQLDGMVQGEHPAPALTFAPTSPALDHGGECVVEDQLGTARPLDGDGDGDARCDVGAWESPAVSPPADDQPPAEDTPATDQPVPSDAPTTAPVVQVAPAAVAVRNTPAFTG